MSDSNWVHLDVEMILAETDNAFLVTLNDFLGEFWIPKSQISDPEDYTKGDVDCTISVTKWIAEQKGIG